MTSNFLSSTWITIAPALGNHLWQSTLFAIAMWLLALLWRKERAQARYWLWMAASLKFLIPFSLLVVLGERLAAPSVVTETKTRFYLVMEQVSVPFTQSAVPHSHVTPTLVTSSGLSLLPSILVAAWLCGLLVVLLVWFLRWRRIYSLMWDGIPLRTGREVEALRRLESVAGTRKPISIRLSHASLEPGVFGILRPVLLWPEGISERLGDEHLEAILAHELWHVRRRDNLAATIHMLVEALFWFHPLVWWLGARLVEERERACDQEVLALGSQRQVYAESILKTCEFCVEAPLACISGVAGADLKQRIVQIMTQGLAEKLSFSRKMLLATIGALAIAAPIVFGLLHAPHVQAQSQTATASSTPFAYEAASIKPSKNMGGLVRIQFSPDALTANGVTPKFLIGFAYNVKDFQLLGLPGWAEWERYNIAFTHNVKDFQLPGLPGWAESERYDIQAKIDDATAQALNKLPIEQRLEQRRLMLQSLLAERFHLKLSHVDKELPTYALVVAKNGPKLTSTTVPATPGGVGQRMFRNSPGELDLTGMPISGLADFLSQRLQRKVVDKTGLQGNYDMTLRWTPDSQQMPPTAGPDDTAPDSSGPSIFTALQEQLGLKLEPQKGPVETLIIDSIQKPTEN